MTRFWRRSVTLSGTRAGGAGSEFISTEIAPPAGVGTARGFQVRLVSGPMTAIVPFLVTNENALTATPADDDVAAESASVALTASATNADLDSDFDNPRVFARGLRAGGNATFSGNGAYSIVFTAWGDTQG